MVDKTVRYTADEHDALFPFDSRHIVVTFLGPHRRGGSLAQMWRFGQVARRSRRVGRALKFSPVHLARRVSKRTLRRAASLIP
jgi:hypothetical protein